MLPLPLLGHCSTVRDSKKTQHAHTRVSILNVVFLHAHVLWQVRDFQAVIGEEVRRQCQAAFGGKPDVLLACVGGGSNAIGLFHEVRRAGCQQKHAAHKKFAFNPLHWLYLGVYVGDAHLESTLALGTHV